MSKYKIQIKDSIIVVLSLLSIFLTIKLWFNDVSNHNFFYSFLTRKVDINSDFENKNFSDPYRLITNYGNKTYSIKYSQIENSENNNVFQLVFSNLNNFKFEEKNNINWEEIYNNRSFIYQYNFPIASNIFLESLNKKNNELINNLKHFNSIIIVPSRNYSKPLNILFVNYEENLIYTFSLDKTNLNSKIDIFDTLKENNLYESSKQLHLPFFENNIYLPKWEDNEFIYNEIIAINPYKDDNGEENQYTIDSYVNNFFDNPNAKISDTFYKENNEKDFYIYSDGSKKTVKYYLNKNVLEYSNYSTVSKNSTSLLKDYDTALTFFNKDDLFVKKNNEASEIDIYLNYYEEFENKRIFYFDYVINNFPLRLSDELKSISELNHMIEITVENGLVTKYKKLTANFEISENTESANIKYLDIINNVFGDFEDRDSNYKNLELVYSVQMNFKNTYDILNLYWALDYDNISYIQPSKNY